ncbi:MAG: homoserine kinase [Myxococcota bacterium]|jgi:homoserine kinase
MASSRPLQLRVPASTSNLGSGFDAFGIALNRDITIRFISGEKTRLERFGALCESTLRLGQDPVIRGMRRAASLAHLSLPTGTIQVEADFPPGRGLGASGAGLSAGLLIGNRLLGEPLSKEELLNEAIALEGNPENAVAAFKGGAHWSAPLDRQNYAHLPIALHRNLRFLLVIPPYPLETKKSRNALPTSVSFHRAVRQAQRPPLLLEGLRSLDPQLIRAGIEDGLHVAPRLKLLRGANELINFAYKAGALGATISGAGSALLIVSHTGAIKDLETRMTSRVKRLWANDGQVISTAPQLKGAQFQRFTARK